MPLLSLFCHLYSCVTPTSEECWRGHACKQSAEAACGVCDAGTRAPSGARLRRVGMVCSAPPWTLALVHILRSTEAT